MSIAHLAGTAPKPEAVVKKRRLIATGDPDFPFLEEATSEEMAALQENFGAS